jgi:tetratricopeptide (TPR) repeat protein
LLKTFIAALAKSAQGHGRTKRAAAALDEAEASLKAGHADLAKMHYLRALAFDRGLALAHERLGFLLTAERRYDDALHHLRAAHRTRPLAGGAIQTFVRVLLQRGEHAEAARVAEEAVAADASDWESWFSLALVHQREHRYAEAIECHDNAVAAGGGDAELYTERAIALQHRGRIAEAHVDYERALAIRPGYTLARFHRSLAHLSCGDYAAGWPDYETRLASADAPMRPTHYPRWDGSELSGRSVLVYGEQGLGDEIMFASCIPDLHVAGARCVIECHPSLQRLFARSFPRAVVYAATPDRRLPDDIVPGAIDCEVPIGSLPLYYRHSASDFPQHEGYLHADPERVAFWRSRLDTLGEGLKVGISWRGGTHATRTALRSITLEEWLPILKTTALKFVSLQYTDDAADAAAQLSAVHGVPLAHWPEAISDYDETAALVTALDLTITVCTSIVHLAGALGRPVWVLAPANPEWRYGNAGEKMLWYPAARVFRQRAGGAWRAVIESVRHELEQPRLWNRAGAHKLGVADSRGAQRCFERALELAPELGESHNNLGIALLEQGFELAGERHIREAIALEPGLLAARENLAIVLLSRLDPDAATAAWNDVLALAPRHAGAHAAKSFLAMREGHFEDARMLARRALELGAERGPLVMQDASMLAMEGEFDAARALLLELRSSAEPAAVDLELAVCALAQGDFAEGWPLYEARLNRTKESPRRPYTFPQWDGARLGAGKALLIMGEQGLGDEIMFSSCYPDALERAGECVIECEPRLVALFARSFPNACIVGGPRSSAHPRISSSRDIACQVHAGSLPFFFRRAKDAFPLHEGYLQADPARVEYWRKRLRASGVMHWVGVSWSGGLRHTRRSIRSIPPAVLAESLRVPGVGFVSLQHDDDGSEAAQIAACAGVPVHVFHDALADLDETAALMKAIDGIMSACSTVVHLAGALGVPTLVLTPARAEWRYLCRGSRLPWYPAARLLRQRTAGDWAPVIDEAHEALPGLAREARLDLQRAARRTD